MKLNVSFVRLETGPETPGKQVGLRLHFRGRELTGGVWLGNETRLIRGHKGIDLPDPT